MDLGQILTDFLNEHRRRKLLVWSGGGLPLEIFLDFYSFKSPFQGFQVIQTGFQLGKAGFLLLKTYLLRKMWLISVKRWKPVWICTCLFPLLNSEDITRKTLLLFKLYASWYWQWGNDSSLVALPYKTVLAMQWFRLKNQWFDGMCAIKSAPLGIHTETTRIVMGEGVELPRHALPFGYYDGTVLYCR